MAPRCELSQHLVHPERAVGRGGNVHHAQGRAGREANVMARVSLARMPRAGDFAPKMTPLSSGGANTALRAVLGAVSPDVRKIAGTKGAKVTATPSMNFNA
jgi:hypothetical protein